MFDSLKSKLKGLNRAASKLDSEKIYETPPEKKEEPVEDEIPEEDEADLPIEEPVDEISDEDLDDDAFFEKLENEYFEERAKESGSTYTPIKTAPSKPKKEEKTKPRKEEKVKEPPKTDDIAEKKRAAAAEKERLAAQKRAEEEAAAEERRLAKAAEKERAAAEKKAKEEAEAEKKRLAKATEAERAAAEKKAKEEAEAERKRQTASAEDERLAARKKAKEAAEAAEKERLAAQKRKDEEAAAEKKRVAAEMAALEAERARSAEEKKKKAEREIKTVPAEKPEKAPEPKKPPVVEEKPISRKEWLKRNKQKPAETKGKFDSPAGDMVGDSGKRIKDDPLDDLLDELEVILLESDVAYAVVQDIILGVRDNLVNKKYGRQYTLEEVVETAVKESVRRVLKVNEFDFDKWAEEQPRPTVIMFVGINGTGKTTTIAKIAKRLSGRGKSVVIAACDTFRAGAIEQLSIHAERVGVKIVKQEQDADPSAVAYDAIEHAKSKKKDFVLLDTAGRMQTNNNLIDEMKKIARISKPALKVFVGDALAGNDAIEQAKVFDAAIGIDAIILTKIDTDAKGGAALSIAHTIGKPIAFVSDGQGYDNLQVFDSNWMLERLFEE